MITVRTSPAYVNRVRQDWTANGGVYGDGGVYAVVPSNDPFAQLGPTLDLTFAGVPTDQLTVATTDGYSINLNLSSEIYQIAVEYAVWSGYQVNYALLPAALTEAALNTEPAKTLFKDTLIGGRPLGDINNDGSVTSADATAYQRFNGPFWLNTADRNDYIRTVLNPYMLANPGLYAAYLTPSTGLAQQTFAEIITFTRTGTGGTFFNSAGVLTAAAADQPRFDYDPGTLAAQGLLIEEQRTNSIRNNTMQGAVAGTPGTLPTNWSVPTTAGLTTNVIGTGTSGGITYIDLQVTGTTSGTSYILVPEAATQIAALNGQTWAMSAWWSIVSGDFTNVTAANFDIRELDAGGVQLATGAISVSLPTATFTRINGTRTNTNASTAFVQPRFRFTVNNTSAVNFTLRIGLPQLELGAFATSVIPTTTTALTRSADIASVNTLSPWLNQTEGTLFAEFTARLGVTQTPATFSGVGGTGYRVRKSGTNQYYAALRDGGSVKDIAITPSPALTEGQIIKVAVGVKLNDCALSGGGQTAVTQPAFSPMPTITDVNLGFTGTDGFALNGWFRRFTYYPRRLANADLQTITA